MKATARAAGSPCRGAQPWRGGWGAVGSRRETPGAEPPGPRLHDAHAEALTQGCWCLGEAGGGVCGGDGATWSLYPTSPPAARSLAGSVETRGLLCEHSRFSHHHPQARTFSAWQIPAPPSTPSPVERTSLRIFEAGKSRANVWGLVVGGPAKTWGALSVGGQGCSENDQDVLGLKITSGRAFGVTCFSGGPRSSILPELFHISVPCRKLTQQ